jgi:hypothetical protein
VNEAWCNRKSEDYADRASIRGLLPGYLEAGVDGRPQPAAARTRPTSLASTVARLKEYRDVDGRQVDGVVPLTDAVISMRRVHNRGVLKTPVTP